MTTSQTNPWANREIPMERDALAMDGSDWTTISRLRDLIGATHVDALPMLMAGAYTAGLWKPGAMLTWSHKRIVKRLGLSTLGGWLFLFSRSAYATRASVKGMVRHMWKGTDKYDRTSWGGFCTAELQVLANLTAIVNRPAADVEASGDAS